MVAVMYLHFVKETSWSEFETNYVLFRLTQGSESAS